MVKILMLCMVVHLSYSSNTPRSPIQHPYPLRISHHVVNMPELLRQGREQSDPLTPTHTPTNSPEVHIEQIRAISKKRIACYMAVTAISSSVLTAVVALSLSFNNCNK